MRIFLILFLYFPFGFKFSHSFNSAFSNWVAMLKKSPSVLIKEAEKNKAEASRLGNFLWPDLAVSGILDRDGSGLTFHQRIPFPGKSVFKSMELKALYAKASEALKQQHIQAYTRLKDAYLDLIFHHRAVLLLAEDLELLKQISEQVGAQVATGRVADRDYLNVEIEQLKLGDTHRRQRVLFSNAMRRLQGELAPAVSLKAIEASLKEVALELPALRQEDILIVDSPMLRASAFEVKREKALKAGTVMELAPDFFLESRQRFGTQRVILEDEERLGITWRIPVTGFTEVGQWKKKRASLERAKQSQRDLRQSLETALEVSLAQYRSEKESHALYQQTLLPATRQWVEEARAAYVTAKISSVEFLNAFRTLVELELKTLGFQIGAAKEIATLERITGRKINHRRKK